MIKSELDKRACTRRGSRWSDHDLHVHERFSRQLRLQVYDNVDLFLSAVSSALRFHLSFHFFPGLYRNRSPEKAG